MAIAKIYERVKRNVYYDPGPPIQTSNHASINHYQDLQEFHIPLERMHNSNLHDWGIARGLEVNGTIGGTEIIVNPGVAIDGNGQLISLSSDGFGANDPNSPTDPTKVVSVPVHIGTASQTGQTVYVTIQFSEILRPNEGALGRMEQVPWVRLQLIGTYVDDGTSIILAIAVIDATGNLAELKNSDGILPYRRHLIGETIGELRIQRSGKVGDSIKELLSGKISPGDGSGLKITIPDAGDNILFAREGGDNFSNLDVRANVSIEAGELGIALDVSKAHTDAVIRAQTATSGNSSLSLLNNGNQEYQIVANRTSNRLEITRPGTVGLMMAFDPDNGNIGIGKNDPQDKLDMGSGSIRFYSGNDYQRIFANTEGLDVFTNKLTDSGLRVGEIHGNLGLYAGDGIAAYHLGLVAGAGMGVGIAGNAADPFTGNGLFVASNGKVGIGTIGPKTSLHIPEQGLQIGISFSAVNNFHIVSDFTGNVRGLRLFNGDYGAGSHLLSVLVNGNVGIGTDNPSEKLTIQGDASAPYALNVGGTSNARIKVRHLDGKDYQSGNLDNLYLQYGVKKHTILNAGGSNGNVGIGTTSPNQKLTLGLGNILLPNANVGVDGNLYFGGVTDIGQTGMRLFGGMVNNSIPAGFIDVRTTDPNDGLRIRVDTVNGGTERMRITANGNVGIGTDNPLGKLDVNGTIYQRGSVLHADYVFESDYQLESIEEHAEFMQREKRLVSFPKPQRDENGQEVIEYGSYLRGIVEELEKAHLYIAKLNDLVIKQQKAISELSGNT